MNASRIGAHREGIESAGLMGAVGLEYYEDAALLRSHVVEKQHAGRGMGKALAVVLMVKP